MRCANCRIPLREGIDAIARVTEGYAEHAHVVCPEAPHSDPSKRVIQGATR